VLHIPKLEGRLLMGDRYRKLANLLVGQIPVDPAGGEAEWMELIALAESEGVAPLLHRVLDALPAAGVAVSAEQVLESAYRKATYESMLLESARARLCRCLGEAEIPVLLLKGAALAFTCYDDPATRPMMDLDLLVPRTRVEEAARCMEEDGFRPHSESLATEMRRRRGHVAYVDGVTRSAVELHWELKVLGRAQRKALPEIWSGARPAGRQASPRVMRLGHAIPLLCAHLILHHRFPRLLWLFDLHRALLAADAAEAAVALDAAARWRLAPCTALTLLRVRELFGTPLPRELDAWARRMASRDGLQARMTALALMPDAPELPPRYLMDLLMNRDWSLLRDLMPMPAALRQSLGLDEHEPITPAYAALIARRLRNGPEQIRWLWRCWRDAPGPRPPRTEQIHLQTDRAPRPE
jgi:Uncharacterised nucleotidyltransferase